MNEAGSCPQDPGVCGGGGEHDRPGVQRGRFLQGDCWISISLQGEQAVNANHDASHDANQQLHSCTPVVRMLTHRRSHDRLGEKKLRVET